MAGRPLNAPSRPVVVSVLVPDPGNPRDATTSVTSSVAGSGVALGSALTAAVPTGASPVPVVTAALDPHRVRRAVESSDLLVVAVPADQPGWQRAVSRLLDACGPLDGRAVFALVVGGWPEAAGRASPWVEAALRRRGATCLAPALHLAVGGSSGTAAIDTYGRYWRPVVPGLIDVARHETVPAAG